MRFHAILGAVLLLGAVLACEGGADSPDPAAAEAREPSAPPPAPIGLGEGFVVWESNRTGRWRIWSRRLDGSGLEQLTADEPDRHHYCPHISPDGRRLAYLSSRYGGRQYPDGGIGGALHLLDLGSGEDRVVVESALTYFENRAVVWRDAGELIFIGPDRVPRLLDLASGEARPLAREVPGEFGWLIDATLGWATTNSATFSVYDREARRIRPRAKLGGCQPYFTHDGRWGVWMAGAGGPIEKMDLATRRVERLLDKNDPRLPDGLRYLYFPMPSRDSRLLAFAASRSQHDHFRSDYEVFVVETDPETLEPIGEPLRLTDDPATDRYPDVFLEPLALGRHRGEAPFMLELAVPERLAGAAAEAGRWQWTFGDGAEAEDGPRLGHRFERPGSYRVVARRGELEAVGQVRVAPAAPPQPVDTRIAGDGSRVEIEFDEPVQAPAAVELAFASGREIAGWAIAADGRTLEIDLTAPFEGIDRLALSGITDRSSPANRMAPATLEVGPPLWPVERDGLVFLWESGEAPNLVPVAGETAERAISLEAEGRARLDHHWAMILDGGRFLADDEDAARVARALQDANEMTVQLTVTPGAAAGAVELVASAGERHQNVRLRLEGGRVVLILRTGNRGPEAYPRVELFPLPVGRPSHVAVTYSPARLAAYLNGEQQLSLGPEAIRGDFFHWRALPLAFGSTEPVARRADVRLEGVAIHHRALPPQAIAAEAERYRGKLAERKRVPRTVVRARLVARSEPPTLVEISPYREALVVFDYEVVEVLDGDPGASRLRVAHWSILEGEVLPINRRRTGETYRLLLERFDRNPQLDSLFVAEAEPVRAEAPLFYAPDPGSTGPP